jgi:hypothetical protein
MSEKTGPYLELKTTALKMAETDRERREAIKALRAKLEKHYGADKVEEAREDAIDDMTRKIETEIDERLEDQRDELWDEVIEELEGEILLKAAATLERRFVEPEVLTNS